MKQNTQSPARKIRPGVLIPIAVLAGLVVLIVFLLRGQTNIVREYRVFHCLSADEVSSSEMSMFDGHYDKDKNGYCNVIAGNNDFIWANETWYWVDTDSPDTLDFTKSDSTLQYINGRLYGITLVPDSASVTRISNLPDSSLKELKSLSLPSEPINSYQQVLRRLAALNPEISIITGSDSGTTQLQFSAIFDFRPRRLAIFALNDQLSSLVRFQSTKSLFIIAEDSSFSNPLPGMKALTSIHLMSGGDSVGVDSKFFTDNGQLQSLNLLSTSLTGDLKFLKHLREITLMPADSGKNIPLSDEQLGRLVSLNFYGTRFEPAQIKQLKHLRKLSTSLALNQENFDAICKSSDNLRIIHLTTAGENPAGIKSFAVFEQLPKLQMLVISDTIPDPLSLTKLKQLQYLSIPDKDYNDKVYLDNLQKSLPNTVITPNSGFCLGSGWLLLLVPLTIFLLFIYKPSAEE